MKKVSGIIPLAEHNSKAAWKTFSSAAVPNVAKSESTCQIQNGRSSYILYQTSVLLSTPFSDCVHFCAHLFSFTSVPAWSWEHLPLGNILFQHRKGVEFFHCLRRFADLNNVAAMLTDAAWEIANERRQLILLLIWISHFQILFTIRICAAIIVRLATEIVSADGAGADRWSGQMQHMVNRRSRSVAPSRISRSIVLWIYIKSLSALLMRYELQICNSARKRMFICYNDTGGKAQMLV